MSNHATIPPPVKGFLYFYSKESEDDKTEYDKNNGKIASLSRVINSMYVIHINVRIIAFLLSNTFGTALNFQGV